jgi:hypothetical protein
MWPRSCCISAMPVSTDVRRCDVPAGDVALEQVVRPHAAAQQLREQLAQHARRRVHAAQQHRLVAERDAGVGQLLARGARLRASAPWGG